MTANHPIPNHKKKHEGFYANQPKPPTNEKKGKAERAKPPKAGSRQMTPCAQHRRQPVVPSKTNGERKNKKKYKGGVFLVRLKKGFNGDWEGK